MQSIILLSILLLITVFSTMLYLKTKSSRLDKLNNGECPSCGEKTKTFYNEKLRTTFKQEVIETKLLKNHGCSGGRDIEYKCVKCDLKEVHTQK